MKELVRNFIQNEHGGFTFEWILVGTLLVIGLVGGLATVRDTIIIKFADTAGAAGGIIQTVSPNLSDGTTPNPYVKDGGFQDNGHTVTLQTEP